MFVGWMLSKMKQMLESLLKCILIIENNWFQYGSFHMHAMYFDNINPLLSLLIPFYSLWSSFHDNYPAATFMDFSLC